jgi:hypothetical protein
VVDLDNLDFQLLNDYLFDDHVTAYGSEFTGHGAPLHSSMTTILSSSSGVGGGGCGRAAAKMDYAGALDDDLDELDDLASTDEEDDGLGGKRRKGNSDGKPKTQAQIDRRRERNRILARRTRLRKKFFFESLQKQVNSDAVVLSFVG